MLMSSNIIMPCCGDDNIDNNECLGLSTLCTSSDLWLIMWMWSVASECGLFSRLVLIKAASLISQ